MPLARMLQASMGEVEDFRRIHLADVEDVAVSGTASLDLTHLFAELLENAVRSSPPDAPVEVSARRRGDGVIVVVADRGMGMTDEQLSEANVLLASPPHAGLSMSRTLGHYVVARLAARYGVVVRVDRSIDGGIVATATLPPALLVADMEAGGFELGGEPVVEDVAAELAPPVDALAPLPPRPLLAPPQPVPVAVEPEPRPSSRRSRSRRPRPRRRPSSCRPRPRSSTACRAARRPAPGPPGRPGAARARVGRLARRGARRTGREPAGLPQRAPLAPPAPLVDPAPFAAPPAGDDGETRPLPRRGRTPVLGVPHQSAVGVAPPNRSPEASRQLLAGFKSGFERGRHAAHEHESDLEGTDG
ncbi:MAG: ATP-binding protein [Thermoleophilia bacterium]